MRESKKRYGVKADFNHAKFGDHKAGGKTQPLTKKEATMLRCFLDIPEDKKTITDETKVGGVKSKEGSKDGKE